MLTVAYTDEREWLTARKDGVGASEVPAILGLVGWGSEYSLWLEKTGRIEHDPNDFDAPRLRRGRKLEPLIAEEYAEATGRALVDAGRHTIMWDEDDESPLFATLDRTVEGTEDDVPCLNCGRVHRGRGVFEAKSAYGFLASDWEDGAPLAPQAQLQTQLGITGRSWGAIGVWIGLDEFRFHCYDADPEVFALIRKRATAFWRCVEDKVPPVPDASEATTRALKRAYPPEKQSDQEIELPPEAIADHVRLEQAEAEWKKWDAERKRARNALRARIGNASTARVGDAVYTLNTVKKSAYQVPATSYRELRRRNPR